MVKHAVGDAVGDAVDGVEDAGGGLGGLGGVGGVGGVGGAAGHAAEDGWGLAQAALHIHVDTLDWPPSSLAGAARAAVVADGCLVAHSTWLASQELTQTRVEPSEIHVLNGQLVAFNESGIT